MSRSIFLENLNERDRVRRARLSLELALSVARRPVVSTKFGPFSAVLLHMVGELAPGTPVVWVDTGYNTRATREFVIHLSDRLGIEPQVFTPRDHALAVPPALDDPAHAAFVEEVKLEPFRRALDRLGADAWLSAVRREQTAHRRTLEPFAEGPGGILKVSPLLEWTEGQMRRYARGRSLPIGPDCYDPTKGEPMRECGLHTRLSA